MFNFENLKETIAVTENTIECPIINCVKVVDRQRHSFRCLPKYYCDKHKIFISPTTFQYEKEDSNILINTREEINLLKTIKSNKRESRIARERSEDALTWNVFRYLDREKLLSSYLTKCFNDDSPIIDTIFWSHSVKEGKLWADLLAARIEFGENIDKGSEPDLIFITKKAVYFIEAKFTSTNKTSGNIETKNRRIKNPKEYIVGSNNLFKELFKTEYSNIVENDMYELLRFWLLGNWIANRYNIDFHLINLVRDKTEKTIETKFGNVIIQNSKRHFHRMTWESIYKYIKANSSEKNILSYFENRTIGYNQARKKQKAFNI